MQGKITRAFLASHVIMADYLIHRYIKLPAQPCHEPHQGIISLLRKLPRLILVAAFNGQGIAIAVIGGIGHLRAGDALDNLPLHPNDKMAAGLRLLGVLEAFEIAPVLCGRRAWVASIMDDNPLYLF